jgi:adenylosuccinate lyase
MALGKAGADRQAMHERLRKHTLVAWESIQDGQTNPLVEDLAADPELQASLGSEEIRSLMDARRYLGDAPQRAHRFAAELRQVLESFPE